MLSAGECGMQTQVGCTAVAFVRQSAAFGVLSGCRYGIPAGGGRTSSGQSAEPKPQIQPSTFRILYHTTKLTIALHFLQRESTLRPRLYCTNSNLGKRGFPASRSRAAGTRAIVTFRLFSQARAPQCQFRYEKTSRTGSRFYVAREGLCPLLFLLLLLLLLPELILSD